MEIGAARILQFFVDLVSGELRGAAGSHHIARHLGKSLLSGGLEDGAGADDEGNVDQGQFPVLQVVNS